MLPSHTPFICLQQGVAGAPASQPFMGLHVFMGLDECAAGSKPCALYFFGPSSSNDHWWSGSMVLDMPAPVQALQSSAASAQAKLDELRVRAAEELGAARADAEAARSQQQELQVGSPSTAKHIRH